MLPFSHRLRLIQDERGRQAGRYVLVSVWNTICHQVTLLVAYSGLGLSGGWSNIAGAAVAAVPAYFLSRAWVWQRSGRHSLHREVLPFWSIAILGLICSTATAHLADAMFGSQIWVNLGSLAGYFLVWVAKFFLLDQLLFPTPPGTPEVAVR